MASTTSSSTSIQSENIPQWKKDLIQRRRQQSKVLASNGASVKLCTAVIGAAGGAESFDNNGLTSVLSGQHECVVVGGGGGGGGGGAGGCKSAQRTSGAAAAIDSHCVDVFAQHQQHQSAAVTSATDGGSTNHENQQEHHHHHHHHHHHRQRQTVAGNMRLDTDALCSDADYDLSDKMVDNKSESRDALAVKLKSSKSADMELSKFASDRPGSEDGESDSSEELQYGPGIVNRLKSKYLNLTLREMNKSRPSVQNFRRAASLEDLLDCDDDVAAAGADKSQRKYAKRNALPGVLAKSERYRNADRGNDSMKRARSVETLLRYNSVSDDVTPHIVPSRFTAGVAKKHHQEPNDHIILIDRTSVKIESKLGDPDRPKPLNKPRRVKLVVDETERPPPDLVKTTMRIFEGSTKKLKPKGEVAAKVATFKTINDTFKAQNQKKIVIPKPPLQPKPFANGVSNKLPPSSPKKNFVVPSVPTVERLEHPDSNFHNEGVITEPIVQSVSSVVSKFQQIEKLRSPSPSPEPLCKFRFSPAASPEPPSLAKSKIKSPPSTPEPRPRIISPGGKTSSPLSPKKDIVPGLNNTSNSSSEATVELETSKPVSEEPSRTAAETSGEQRMEIPRSVSPVVETNEDRREDEEEVVDGGKSISKTALENIAKAGTTMQFSFNDRAESSCGKNYLPGYYTRRGVNETTPSNKTDDTQDGTAISSVVVPRMAPPVPERSKVAEITATKSEEDKVEPTANGEATERSKEEPRDVVVEQQSVNRVQDVAKSYQGDGKPIGAISSLGLIKSNVATSTTTTSYPQCNDAKTIKTQKTESHSSPPQKQIGIIRPLVSTKTQVPQQNLSNREIEKNLINRVKSIEQPTKVVVSLKSAEEIQPVKKTNSNSGGGGVGGNGGNGGGLWDTKPWNDQNNTMVFNFINREEVPDYIENDGLRVRRKRAKPKAGEGGIIVLDSTLDASTTDEAEWEMTGGPPSPCNVSFLNDNILINGRSNLSKQPRNHKHRIQFDDTATRTFEYPSEASMLVGEGSKISSDSSVDRTDPTRDAVDNRPPSVSPTPGVPSVLGGGGLASYTPSKVDLASEGFELGVTRASPSSTAARVEQPESLGEVDYLKPAQDAGAWGSETTADLLF